MKANKINILLICALAAIGVTSCVQDDDFKTPEAITGAEPVIVGTLTDIDAIKDAVAQEGGLVTFEDTADDLYVEGYVVSSDASGNFFEEIIVQDSAENPTAGIRISANVGSLFNKYEFGRKIYIKLEGLSAAPTNGVVSLGIASGSSLGQLEEAQLDNFIVRSTELATIVPTEVNIADFDEALENTYIKLADVQFPKSIALGNDRLTFSGEPTDSFDGERTLESCATGMQTILSTSTFADFKSVLLPQNRGSISGVLTRDFGDDFYTIIVNKVADLDFSNTDRCDAEEIACGLATDIGTTNLFADNFETGQTTNSPITGNGWTNYQQEGTETWEAYTSGGTNASLGISARVGSFNSGDASTIAWLISPQIDLDAQDGETLRFQTSNSFSDGSDMEVLFSRDWDGTEANVTSATWGIFPDATVVQDSDFFGDWIESGNVDLSCESGTIYIAFRYTGNGDAGFDGTYELDEISIDAN